MYGWEQGAEEQSTTSLAQKQGIIDVESQLPIKLMVL